MEVNDPLYARKARLYEICAETGVDFGGLHEQDRAEEFIRTIEGTPKGKRMDLAAWIESTYVYRHSWFAADKPMWMLAVQILPGEHPQLWPRYRAFMARYGLNPNSAKPYGPPADLLR